MVRLVDPSQAHLNWTERWQLDYGLLQQNYGSLMHALL